MLCTLYLFAEVPLVPWWKTTTTCLSKNSTTPRSAASRRRNSRVQSKDSRTKYWPFPQRNVTLNGHRWCRNWFCCAWKYKKLKISIQSPPGSFRWATISPTHRFAFYGNGEDTVRYSLIDRLIDWLIDWLGNSTLIGRLIDWLIDWVIAHCLVEWLIDWLTGESWTFCFRFVVNCWSLLLPNSTAPLVASPGTLVSSPRVSACFMADIFCMFFSSHERCISSVARHCVAEQVQQRPAYILDICPEKGLDLQNFACAECRKAFPMDKPDVWESQSIRLCDYNGKYYCPVCHRNDLAVSPGRVVKNWDFSPRLVRFSLFFLPPPSSTSSYAPHNATHHSSWSFIHGVKMNLVFCVLLLFQVCRESKQILNLLSSHPILNLLEVNKDLSAQVRSTLPYQNLSNE